MQQEPGSDYARPRAMLPVSPLEPRDASGAAGVLARAFEDSPVYAAVLTERSPAARLRTLTRVKRGFVAALQHHGESRAVRDPATADLVGVALVLGLGGYPLSMRDELFQSAGCVTAGPLAIARFLRLTAYMRRRHLAEPHFYLFALGVEPARQGRGVGKALLADLNARADAARAPCFLETEKAINVRLYESVGYRVVTDEPVTGLGVRMWTMVRPPSV